MQDASFLNYEDETMNISECLDNLKKSLTPMRLLNTLNDLHFEKVSCHRLRGIYNILEKILEKIPETDNYKEIFLGCSWIRNIIRVVSRELIIENSRYVLLKMLIPEMQINIRAIVY